MKLPPEKILIHFTQESIDAIYFEKVIDKEGKEQFVEINSAAEDLDDRLSTLFTQLAIVEAVGANVTNTKAGDIGIISYELFNDQSKCVSKDDTGRRFVIDAVTTYHDSDNIAEGNQINPRNQLVWRKGEVEHLSQLIGVIRDGKLIANHPYVFVKHLRNHRFKKDTFLIEIEDEIVRSKVISISERSGKIYGVNEGQLLTFNYADCFEIQIADKKILALNDCDMLMVEDLKLKAV